MFAASDIVLALFAHPDDAELACFGTLARLRSLGCAVHGHTVTRGEATSTCSCSVNRLRRTDESAAAARLIASTASWDRLPDGRVSPWAPTVDAIGRRIRSVQPTVLITHHPRDPGHQDHRTVGQAVVQVALKVRSVRCVLLAEPPVHAGDFDPTLFVDVTDHYAIKRQAVAAALAAGRRFEAFEVRRIIID